MSVINWPILYISDPLVGKPLFRGKVFVGIPDLDPEDGAGNPINSKQLRVVLEDGSKVNVGQPFELSQGGNPVYNGKTVRLDVDGNFSIKILNNNNVQKYYIENVFEGQPITELDLINDLSQDYEFPTRQLMIDSLIVFPDKKVLHVTDVDAVFVVTAGASTNIGSPDIAGGNHALLVKTGQMNIDKWGAGVGGDDLPIINAAKAEWKDLTASPSKTYLLSGELSFDASIRFECPGHNTVFKWTGGNQGTPPDKNGGVSVIKIAPSNVTTGTLSNAIVGGFTVDLDGAENLIGVSCIRATSQSKVHNIKSTNISIGSFGWFFSKEWYAEFNALQARPKSGFSKEAGTVGFYMSCAIDQINGNDFGIQCLEMESGVVLDTSDAYIYALRMKGYIERCGTAIKHVAGLGVRTALFNVYFENNTLDIDWGDTVAGSDTTSQVTWLSCSFNAAASSVKIDEGTHQFLGCDRIVNMECNGGEVFVDGNPGMSTTGTNSERVTHKVEPSYTLTSNRYGTARSTPAAGSSSMQTAVSGIDSKTFLIPSDMYRTDRVEGAVVYFKATGRRSTDSTLPKVTEGYLVRSGAGSWGLELISDKSSFEWALTANVGGGLDIDYSSTGATKYITVKYEPM